MLLLNESVYIHIAFAFNSPTLLSSVLVGPHTHTHTQHASRTNTHTHPHTHTHTHTHTEHAHAQTHTHTHTHSKVTHPNILPLLAVTLTSEPTSLVMVSGPEVCGED